MNDRIYPDDRGQLEIDPIFSRLANQECGRQGHKEHTDRNHPEKDGGLVAALAGLGGTWAARAETAVVASSAAVLIAFGRLAATTVADVFNNEIDFVEYVCAGHASYLQSPSGGACFTTVEASGRAQWIQWRRSRIERRGRRKNIRGRSVLGQVVVVSASNVCRGKFIRSTVDSQCG